MYLFARTLRSMIDVGFVSLNEAISSNTITLRIENLPYASGTFQWVVKANKTDLDGNAKSSASGSLSANSLTAVITLSSDSYTVGQTYYFALRVFNVGGQSQEVIQVSFTISQNAVLGQGENQNNLAPIYLGSFTTSERDQLTSNKALLIFKKDIGDAEGELQVYYPTTDVWEPIGGISQGTLDTALNLKVDKVTGKGLSSNDLTDLLKTAYDSAVTWISTNGSNILNHLLNTSNPHGVTKSQVGLDQVDNTSDANKPISTTTQTALNGKVNYSDVDTPNGVAPLDSGGKIPLANLPSTLLKYVGTWNASTNTPTLVNPDLTKKGNVYNVAVAGTQFGIAFNLGDWLIYNDSGIPEKSDNSDDVVSVFGRTGPVVAQSGDYTTAQVTEDTNLYFTVGRVLASALSGLSLASSAAITAADTVLSAIGKLQAQITTKQDIITGGVSNLVTSQLLTSRAMVSNGTGKATSSTTTAAEILHVNGVTSPIQAQLDARVSKNTLDINNLVWYTDWLNNGEGGWASFNSGSAGAASNMSSVNSDISSPGILQMATGTTTTGRSDVRVGAGAFLLGGGAFVFETKIRIPTLSDATDTFTFIAGFTDASTADPVDGVYFRYTHGTNSGKWEARTRSNTANESIADTGITVTANQWYKLRIEINAAGTSCVFKIDGVTVATLNTAANIPTGTGRNTGIEETIFKSAGTTSRSAEVDYSYLNYILTTPR